MPVVGIVRVPNPPSSRFPIGRCVGFFVAAMLVLGCEDDRRSISGRVVDVAGPVKNVEVSAYEVELEGDVLLASVQTDSAGEYLFDHVVPESAREILLSVFALDEPYGGTWMWVTSDVIADPLPDLQVVRWHGSSEIVGDNLRFSWTTEPALDSSGLPGSQPGWVEDATADWAEIDRRLLLAPEVSLRVGGNDEDVYGVHVAYLAPWTSLAVDVTDDLAHDTTCSYGDDSRETTPVPCPITDRDAATTIDEGFLYVIVDLGSPQAIESVSVIGMSGPGDQYQVLLSDDGATFGSMGVFSVEDDLVVELPTAPVTARYVRIEAMQQPTPIEGLNRLGEIGVF